MTPTYKSQTFTLLSPCFCAGANIDQPEMRMASIRGQLRWWHRVLHGAGKPEYSIFGGVKGKQHGLSEDSISSSFRFTITPSPNNADPIDKKIVPHKPQKSFNKKSLPKGNDYTLSWIFQPHPYYIHNNKELTENQLQRTLKIWLLLGTVGRRATRAMGSVWPINYKPSIEAFKQTISDLNLPENIYWAVLDQSRNSDLPYVAGETIHGLKKNDYIDDPLGYTAGKERKSSPLRFKIGKFEEGERLIAVFDNRNNRGGGLSALEKAINDMSPDLKELLLSSSFSDGAPSETSQSQSGDDEVSQLLNETFTFSSIALYKAKATQWKDDNDLDSIQQFIDGTQDAKYGGLRNQPWYKELSS